MQARQRWKRRRKIILNEHHFDLMENSIFFSEKKVRTEELIIPDRLFKSKDEAKGKQETERNVFNSNNRNNHSNHINGNCCCLSMRPFTLAKKTLINVETGSMTLDLVKVNMVKMIASLQWKEWIRMMNVKTNSFCFKKRFTENK